MNFKNFLESIIQDDGSAQVNRIAPLMENSVIFCLNQIAASIKIENFLAKNFEENFDFFVFEDQLKLGSMMSTM